MTTDPTTSVPFVYAHPHLFAPTEQGPDRRVMGEFTFTADGELAAAALNAYAGYPVAPHPLGYIPIGEVRAMLEEIAGTDLDPRGAVTATAAIARAQLDRAVTAAQDHLRRWNADAPVSVPWESSGPPPATDFEQKTTAALEQILQKIDGRFDDLVTEELRGLGNRVTNGLNGVSTMIDQTAAAILNRLPPIAVLATAGQQEHVDQAEEHRIILGKLESLLSMVASVSTHETMRARLDAIDQRLSDLGAVVSRTPDGRNVTALAGRVGNLLTELENQATAATTRHQATLKAVDAVIDDAATKYTGVIAAIGMLASDTRNDLDGVREQVEEKIRRAHADQNDLRVDVQRLVATMNQLGEAGLLEHPNHAEHAVHDLVAEVPEYDLWRDALMLATASWNHGAGQASPTAIIDRAIQFMPTLRSRAGATGIGPDELPAAAADVVHAYAEGGVLPCCGRRAVTGTRVDVDPRHVTCTGARDQAWPQVFDVLDEAPARMGDARAVVHLRPKGTPLVARCCGKELGVQDQWHYDANRVTCDGPARGRESAPEPI